MKRLRILIALKFLLAAALVHAYPPTYGTEFNFTSEAMKAAFRERIKITGDQTPGRSETNAAKRMSEEVAAACGNCSIVEHPGKFGHTEYRVKFPDGFSFNISVDPKCVEIQTDPATAKATRDQAERIEKYIFAPAKKAGLITEGSAHLNIGARSAFENDPRGFMRFLVDYANWVGLGRGILGISPDNGPLISSLKPEQRRAFEALIEDVNSGTVRTIEEISLRMNYEVYTHTPGFNKIGSGARHYQAIGLKQLLKDAFQNQDMPFEIRPIRQQANAEEYALLTELMDARIDFLKNKKESPIFFVETTTDELNLHSNNFHMKALEFKLYVEEMGLDIVRFAQLLGPNTTNALTSKWLSDFLAGKAKWEKASLAIFNTLYVKGSLTSPFLEEEMFKLLEKSRAPRKIWSDTLAELALQALKSDMAWDAAHAASKRFTERANSAGMELTLDAEVFAPRRPVAPKIQVAESPIRLGFSARCKRFLSRLIP